jgi:hypothetical protein
MKLAAKLGQVPMQDVPTILQGAQSALDGLPSAAGFSGPGAACDPAPIGTALAAARQAIVALGIVPRAPQAALAALTGPLELLESATTQQPSIPDQVQGLLDVLEKELAAPGGLGGRLARLVAALGEAPEGQALGNLLAGWLQAGGIDPEAARLPFGDLAAGLQGAVDVLGGLTSLESVLAEGERLATLLAGRLDPGAVDRRLGEVARALERAAAEPDQGPGLLRDARVQVDDLGASVAEDMGFGEATLLYLDLPRLQIDIKQAAAAVDAADTAALARALEALANRLLALAGIDLDGIAERRLDELLDDLEARSAELAGAIDAADSSFLTAPIAAAVSRLQEVSQRLAAAIAEAVAAVRTALEEIGEAVAALPVAAVADAIQGFVAPVRQAITDFTAWVTEARTELDGVAGKARDAVSATETELDEARSKLEEAFRDLAAYVDSLPLDEVIGQVEDGVRGFADQVAAFQMKPYVDAAVTAIDDAAGVLEKVPFDLLPSSMKDEVHDLVQPLKSVDPEDLRDHEPDWDEVLAALDDAVETVQEDYDELIAEVRRLDPRALAADLDAGLADLAEQVRGVSPQEALEPLSQAVAELRSAVASIHFDAELARLQAAFDGVLAQVDGYSPAALAEPLCQRVDEARERLKAELRIAEWSAALSALAERAETFLALLDPERAEEEIRAAWEEARRLLDTLPELLPAAGFGTVIAAFLTGTGLRVQPLAFEVVVRWIGGGSGDGAGPLALQGRTGRLAQAIEQARAAVAAVDPQVMLAQLLARIEKVRGPIESTPAGRAALQELEAATRRALGSLVDNRKRYLAALIAAAATAELLSRMGFVEAGSGVLRLRVAVDPLRALWQLLLRLLARAGVHGLEEGLTGLLRGVLDAAPPERVASILAPILRAMHGRLSAAVEDVRQELDLGVQELIGLLDQLDLAPLREALAEVHLEIRGQVEALSPNALLGEAAQDLQALQAEVLALDPAASLEEGIAELEGAARLLEEIDAADVLKVPIGIWEELLATFGDLDLAALLAPLRDSLAGMQEDVESGFDQAITAYERLQEALPA